MRLLLSLVALLLTGCPFAAPGLRGDVGVAAATASHAVNPSLHVTAGASAASVVPMPGWPVDFGAGYVLFFPSAPGAVHGAYVDGAYLHALGDGWRLSFGGRAEWLLQERPSGIHAGTGGALRFAVEQARFVSGRTSASGRDTFVTATSYGNQALGLTAELGVRRLPGAQQSVYAMVGLTVRVPAFAGLLFFIPSPK